MRLLTFTALPTLVLMATLSCASKPTIQSKCPKEILAMASGTAAPLDLEARRALIDSCGLQPHLSKALKSLIQPASNCTMDGIIAASRDAAPISRDATPDIFQVLNTFDTSQTVEELRDVLTLASKLVERDVLTAAEAEGLCAFDIIFGALFHNWAVDADASTAKNITRHAMGL
jgi:hypothetical protein